MIDWLTFQAPLAHTKPIHGDTVLVLSSDGEAKYQKKKSAPVVGSYDSRLFVSTCDYGKAGNPTHIRVHGNPVKWFQGHNVFGSNDVHGIVMETMRALARALDVIPTPDDVEAWTQGHVELYRVDITESHDFGNNQTVTAVIRTLEQSAYLKHRGKGTLYSDQTLYFGQHSRRWSIKMYNKYQEMQVKGHQLPKELHHTSLPEITKSLLRTELTLRRPELLRQDLEKVLHWTDTTPAEVFAEKLAGLDMSQNHVMTADDLEAIPLKLRAVYQLWAQGSDLRQLYPRRTFYRHRKALLEHGVDISIQQPSEKEDSNVVPLVRIVEAKPFVVPEWAIGTDLYFEPRHLNRG